MLTPSGVEANAGMTDGYLAVTGIDPLVGGRFARFMGASQGQPPESVGLMFEPHALPPAYRALRCDLWLRDRSSGTTARPADPLPRLALVGRCEVVQSEAEARAATLDPRFDPAATVVLESPPDPAPRPSADAGTARVVSETTDELEIVADLRAPQVLLVTDAYADGWHAVAVEPAPQPAYRVLPADATLRAIPLAAGHHHFRLEYRPLMYVVGKWISILALAGYLTAAGAYFRSRTPGEG